MDNKLRNVFLFTAGAAIGSAVTWKIVKTKYEQIAQEEIDSVKDEYVSLMQKMKEKLQEDVSKVNDDDSDDEEPDVESSEPNEVIEHSSRVPKKESLKVEYSKLASRYRSSEDVDKNENDGEGGMEEMDETDELPYINGPYTISPEEFRCSPPGYNAQALDYFADGVLADSWGVEVDIEDTVGEDTLECFGEYVDDIVYVRNERKEIDYEVTRDPRTYEEAVRANTSSYYGQ